MIAVLALLGAPASASLCEVWGSQPDPWPLGTVLTYGGIRYELIDPLASAGKTAPGLPGPWKETDKACLNGRSRLFPITVDARVRRFGIWTTGTINLNDRVDISPWWMGSNSGPVNLGASTVVQANVNVGGDVLVRSYGHLAGALWHTGSLTQQAGSNLAQVERKTALTPLSIALPATTFPATKGNQFAQPDSRLDLPPGSYGSVTVNARATLVLHGAGGYSITQLNVEPSATIEVQFGGSPLVVWIRDGILFKEDAKFSMVGGDASDILWMVHGSRDIHLGSYGFSNRQAPSGSGFQGTLIAPAAHVDVGSDAAFTGTLYARALTVHQNNHFFRFVPYDGNPSTRDSDGDGLEDSTELRIGSDPRGVDTDDDGLTDELELRGRGLDAAGNPVHRFGMEAVMKPCREAWKAWRAKPVGTKPACREFDGAVPDRGVRNRLHPTRRDAFLRLLWEPSSVLQAEGKVGFESAAADPWINQAMATNFANLENHHAVPDSDVVAVPSREIALHLDAGATASVNMPPDVERFGGPHLVASGGTNQGVGPWSYDLATGSGQKIQNSLDEPEIKALMKQFGETVPQSRSFWDLFHFGFLVAHSLLETMTPPPDGYAFGYGSDYFTVLPSPRSGRDLAITMLHEYGHNLTLKHPPAVDQRAWIWEGVMSYSIEHLLGCTLEKWNPATNSGSKDDARWCGDLPPKELVPANFPNAGQDWYRACDPSSRVLLRDATGAAAWTCQGIPADYNNRAPLPTDLPRRMGRGSLDLTTGYLKNYPLDQIEATDYTFSRGRLCSRTLSALDESKGLAICKERGVDIPEQSFGPIDFNANGVIDAQPIDLFNDQVALRRWFWDGIRDLQKDLDEWGSLKLHPANTGTSSSLIGVPCRNRSRWSSVTLTTCTN